MLRLPATLAALLATLLLVACGDDGSAGEGDGAAEAEPAAEQQGPCRDVDQPEPRDDGGQEKPAKRLDPKKRYEAVLVTSCGDITISLDAGTSPAATASFAELARSGFYDDTIFHRIVPGYVIQAGDPTAGGGGDPGYATRDRVPRDTTYRRGVVAMAKGGSDPPGHAGSQFFIVMDDAAGLEPAYAVLGEVSDGMDVVDAIGELGNPATGTEGTPVRSVIIEEVRIDER